MKKPNLEKENRQRTRKEHRELLRLRKSRKYQGLHTIYSRQQKFLIQNDERIIEN